VVTLAPDELKRLDEKESYQGKTYLVWDTRRDNFTRDDFKARPALLLPSAGGTAPEGRFLVDPETGRIAWYVDPTIGGKIKEHDGRETTRFDAPKTRVMTIIIDGVLTQKLNWSLVLIGALMAVTLELCGVSSLAFAVGVYVPIQYSTPIFMGGILRWAVDAWQARSSAASIEAAGDDAEARARAEIEAIRKSETSPGVLLASGYIAGGSLAGVVVAFLEFAPSFQKTINLGPQVADLGVVNDVVALALFAFLIGFAILVGMGMIFKPAEEDASITA
jgi:hypothetical protein